jgi:threonine synthase
VRNKEEVVAQIVYYAKGIFDIQKENNLPINTKIDVSVPTGNFGDILAGYYARKIGIPVGKLILATNENNVLDIFFKQGVYKVRKKEEVVPTDSPSMDITSASNFERFVYDMVDKNPAVVKALWRDIREKKFFDISKTNYFENVKKSEMVSGFATRKERYSCIKEIYDTKKYIIDTHTANAVHVAKEYKKSGTFMMCIGTASPVKFEESIREALNENVQLNRPEKCIDIEKKPQKFVRIERMDIDSLRKFIETNALKD